MPPSPAVLGAVTCDAPRFDVRSLYLNGEAGAVYDPSDLTAEKVAWRRNLLTWSEDFTNAAWSKTNATITANAGTSWDGTATASKLTPTVTNAEHWISQTVAPLGALSHTISFYAKADGYSVVQVLNANDATDRINFDLATGLVGSATTYTGTITSVGGGWYRITATYTTTTSVLAWARIAVVPSSTSARGAAFAGDGTSGVLIDSSQFELGPTATAYQRITDFTSDFLAAFPTHTLFQDSAGTTPVTALGQPVGLVIDSKTGGLANLGPELFTNPDCTSLTGFVAGGTNPPTLTFSGGVRGAQAVDDGAGRIETTTITGFVVGRMYMVEVTATNACTKGNLAASGFTWGTIADTNFALGTTTKRILVTATATSGVCRYYLGNVADNDGNVATITRHSVREVPGVHAIQPTSASRPLLDARVNLLTFSEQFDNAAWTKLGSGVGLAGVVTANAGIAPDGTSTADRVQLDCGNAGSASNRSQVIQNFTAVSGGGYKTALYIKAWDSGNIGKTVRVNSDAIGGGVYTLTADWQLVGVTGTASGTSSNFNIETRGTFTTQTADLLVWGADLRLATDAAYPYQRVTTATDYADVGAPRSFLFDGVDDSLYTASNMDLSGTDKVTVLAGVRKLSDANFAPVVELSATVTNNGAFAIYAPGNTGVFYQYAAKGTALADVFAGASQYAAPHTAVVTGQSNIAAPSLSLRVNAVLIGSSTASQGTGNYSSAVLFIGRRNNVSNPFNGKAYQLIVRGAATDAGTLVQAERYVAQRTGITL